jgi:multidrug resistance efflux pump
MVNKKKAFKVALISALAVGVIHYFAHMWIAPKLFPTTNPVMVVGITVVLAVFLIGYYGMIGGKD